ncbi:MAG: hypothetical protein K0M40_21165 [Prolixibacteraceae bacterium]|nr:hypothetical protein [Prolixibacteraceae bacterium]
MKTKVIYNITIDELAPQGFQIWQELSKTGAKYGILVNKALLTNRSDSIDFTFNLWQHGTLNIGDTIWLHSQIISMKTSDTGTTIAKTDLFPIIIQ